MGENNDGMRTISVIFVCDTLNSKECFTTIRNTDSTSNFLKLISVPQVNMPDNVSAITHL